MELRVDLLVAGDACEIAKSRWRQAALFRFLYGMLIFVLSLVFLAVIILVISLFVTSRSVEAIVTGAGGIVDGVIVGFLLARRNEAVAEETAAFEAMSRACPPDLTVDRSKFVFLGL
jgi:hypothetical protein